MVSFQIQWLSQNSTNVTGWCYSCLRKPVCSLLIVRTTRLAHCAACVMLLKTITTRLSASRGNETARGQETLVNPYVCKQHESNLSITLSHCVKGCYSVPPQNHPPTYLSSYSCLLLARHQDLWQPARILLSACALTAEIKEPVQEREGDRCCSCC